MTKITRAALTRRSLLAGASAGLISSRVWAQQPSEVKVGLLVPISGLYARPGAVMRHGAEMGVEHINAQGGIKSLGGAKLKLDEIDSGEPDAPVVIRGTVTEGRRATRLVGSVALAGAGKTPDARDALPGGGGPVAQATVGVAAPATPRPVGPQGTGVPVPRTEADGAGETSDGHRGVSVGTGPVADLPRAVVAPATGGAVVDHRAGVVGACGDAGGVGEPGDGDGD